MPGRAMYRRIADSDVAELRRRYAAGASLEALVAACGLSRRTVARRLRAAGCPIRPRGSRRDPRHPGAGRLRGLGVGRVAALLGVTRKTAARWLRGVG